MNSRTINTRFVLILLVFAVSACSTPKKEVAIYRWTQEEESKVLTLFPDGKFDFRIAGYQNRTTHGVYVIEGDTLILNPGKSPALLQSIEAVDELFEGERFVDVRVEEITWDAGKVVESYYSEQLFPVVLVDGKTLLAVNDNDPTYKKLRLPDSLKVDFLECHFQLTHTCVPVLELRGDVAADLGEGKSYHVNISSAEREENFLAGYKWLIQGDEIIPSFSTENCDPADVKLIKQDTP